MPVSANPMELIDMELCTKNLAFPSGEIRISVDFFSLVKWSLSNSFCHNASSYSNASSNPVNVISLSVGWKEIIL